MYALDTGDDRVLGIIREYHGQKMLGLFNFSEDYARTEIETADWRISLPERALYPGEGRTMEYWIEPFGFRWFVTDRN